MDQKPIAFDLVHPDFTWEGIHMDIPTLLARMESDLSDTRPWIRARAQWVQSWLQSDAPLEVLTSGTTGAPKSIFFTKAQAHYSCKATGQFLGLGAGTRALIALSCDYVAGKMMWIRALTLGWSITEVDPGASPWSEQQGPFDFVALVPLQLAGCKTTLSRFKQVLVGGAPLGAPLISDLLSGAGLTKIWVSFGMAETLTHFALAELSDDPGGLKYKPLPGVTLAQNNQGCLVVDYPSLQIHNFVTRDVVELDDEDGFIWLGRADNAINSGGIKLYPEKIGQLIGHLIDGPFDLGGVADPKWGVALGLATEKRQGIHLLQTLADSGLLMPSEVPKYLWVIDLPKTASGKVKSRELWQAIAQGSAGDPIETKH
ncbi:MAG: AMP-binding protein [Flavobacteriaceae bacterium]|nr:AMP-binding protein [Flavobacteriaceae bacterium]MDP4885440.1 AMP-binding protein [Flavobacteriaceae bacterium]MDP4971336.1 AMP-binding protein [Flavobacteriaceae bacterium]